MTDLRVLTLTALTALGLTALPAFGAEDRSHEAQEKPIELSQVPQAAMQAGEKAIGGKATEAKILQDGGKQVYELERKDDSGKEHSAHVTPEGKVIGIEE